MRLNKLLTLFFLVFSGIAFSQDQQKIDSVLKVLQSASVDTVKLNCYIALGSEYKNNEPEKAKGFVCKALELAQQTGNKKGMASAYHLFGMIHSALSNNDKAME